MDNEVSLARSEDEGQSVLLASSGTGRAVKATVRGEKRTEEDTPPSRYKRAETEASKKASKNNPADKRGDGKGSRGKKHRHSDKARSEVRGTEGTNKTTGRSTEFMGVKFGDSYCPDRPHAPHAHYWIAGHEYIDSGIIFQCKYCLRHRWLPLQWNSAVKMSWLIDKFGSDEGYRRALVKYPAAGRLMIKLQDLWSLRKMLPDKQYWMAVAAVMADKEYPHEEERI